MINAIDICGSPVKVFDFILFQLQENNWHRTKLKGSIIKDVLQAKLLLSGLKNVTALQYS